MSTRTRSRALAEPTTEVSGRWIAALSAATLGMWIAVLTPIQVLLPLQIEAIDPAAKVVNLAWVTTVAAIASIVACPLAGALSDRTTSRFGRRRPWILAGAVVGALGLVLTGTQWTVLGVAAAWVLVQVCVNTMTAALTATVPDQVPVRQRGTVSAFVGLPLPIALVAGTFLVTTVVTDRTAGYVVLAVLLVVLVLPFVASPSDPRLDRADRAPWRWGEFVRGFWIDPRRQPDYAWAFAGRFAIQLANAVGTLYLLYYLRDVIHHERPERGVFVLILLYTAGVVVSSVLVGRWSDRSGRRKVFVVASSTVVAAALMSLALWQTWTSAVCAAALMGLGYGVYLAVDNALITQVLPSARDRAKDLGVINMANTAPQAFAPAIAGAIISLTGGYAWLYLVAALCALVGAALVQPIRGVR